MPVASLLLLSRRAKYDYRRQLNHQDQPDNSRVRGPIIAPPIFAAKHRTACDLVLPVTLSGSYHAVAPAPVGFGSVNAVNAVHATLALMRIHH